MTAIPAQYALLDMFPNANGREYTLTWKNGNGKGQSGYIRMTDLLFNYYFTHLAFGFDGAYEERSVAGSSNISVTRRIGGPSKTYSRASYKRKITPTFRTSAYDTGTQLYAVDGDDLWNFEVGGKLEEFRIWAANQGKLMNIKRTFTYRTATGVGASVVPLLSLNP